ncbi:hypothetical protein HYH02_001760 [Chlamydomonas schloesseri]|uniref:Methyltransferase domain-containing protein n=1 Tax=Chlamydomonas schloesseri TaxID=2026947 RepID=A0A835WVP2_9CHLO|nr:hypothetical protein HYH02_001760 [Chlamydomonas schloesseri]|eukprot:KAG2453541.1 hypothetical protein HYH02_001760 [Chlamydomonas schloesseri]
MASILPHPAIHALSCRCRSAPPPSASAGPSTNTVARAPLPCAASRRFESSQEDQDEWRQRRSSRGSGASTKGARRRERADATEGADAEDGGGGGRGARGRRPGPSTPAALDVDDRKAASNGRGRRDEDEEEEDAAVADVLGEAAVDEEAEEEEGSCGEGEEEDVEEEGEALGPRSAEDGFFDGKSYRLVPTESGENTILINGVKMHISMSKRPSQDAEDKCRLIKVRKGSTVLDICCGLGYSASAAARLGARRVVTLELDANVLEVARQNPASAALFDPEGPIQIVMGPAQESIKAFEDESFSGVMHDPPRFSFAGELYSQAFYNEVFRVLKCGGRFFHYTGNPGGRSSIPNGVKRRMMAAGFVNVKWVDTCQGMLGIKP